MGHGIIDQWRSCLNGDFDGKKKRMKSRKASRLVLNAAEPTQSCPGSWTFRGPETAIKRIFLQLDDRLE